MREIGLNLSQLDEGGRDLSDQLVVFSAVTLKNLLPTKDNKAQPVCPCLSFHHAHAHATKPY
jgi:hypothetical protein